MTLPTRPPVLLLTRPRPQSEHFARLAASALPPHEAVIAPLTDIVPLPVASDAFAGARGLVLTSANAVAMVAHLAPMPAWCVGAATAQAARSAGFDVRISGGDAAHLIADLASARPAGPLVHAHGVHLAADLSARLDGLVDLRGVAVYEARTCDWPAGLVGDLTGRQVIAPLFSPRAAELLAGRIAGLRDVTAVAISLACAARLPQDMRVLVSATPDTGGILSILVDVLSQGISRP